MCFVPLSKWGSVDLDDGGFCEGICSDEFVVGRMVSDDNDTDFTSNALRAPREVARFETKSTEFPVASSSADKMDALGADTGIGRLAAFFKGPKQTLVKPKNQFEWAVESTSSCDSRRV